MRITFAGVAVGFILYWGMQHFLGIGNTGRASAR